MPALENTAAEIARLESQEADLLHSLSSQNLSCGQKADVQVRLNELEIEIERIRQQIFLGTVIYS